MPSDARIPSNTVVVDDKTWERLENAAQDQLLSVHEYASGLLREAMAGEWVSVHALMDMADELRGKGTICNICGPGFRVHPKEYDIHMKKWHGAL